MTEPVGVGLPIAPLTAMKADVDCAVVKLSTVITVTMGVAFAELATMISTVTLDAILPVAESVAITVAK
jgi:hypothetical protein